jgi:hypothetical protein
MKRRIARWFGCATLLIIGAGPALARQDNPQGPPMRGPAMERVEQWKKVRMMEILKLDEESSIRFFSRYNKEQQEIRDIQRKREELMRQLESSIQSNAGEKELEKTIQDLQALEGKAIDARDSFLKDARGILTLKQLASYVVFENNFNRSLRELMRDMPQQRMDRPQRRQF